ncbi:MAG TPA: ChbG/HpnK family deacetylase [bacterium]|nr:ChbG/HpnK family deacetylase [bacterium]
MFRVFIGILVAAIFVFTRSGVSPAQTNESENSSSQSIFGDGKTRLIIRVDDIGFTHAANLAMKKLAEEGCVTAASVMVTTPWLDEAVELLKQHPEISVGVHTCLNCEWMPYRWGPVSPVTEVPTLVDEWGKFFGSRQQLRDNNPNVDEVEKEIRAQVDLALKKGLKISYMDHHMSAAVDTPAMRERFEKVAREYGLAISRWFGEKEGPAIYSVEPDKKADFLLAEIEKLESGNLYLMVGHPGMNTPELAVLKDIHPWAPQNMSEHREAETNALCDPRFKELLAKKGIELVGYDIIKEKYLDRMARPAE